MQFVVHDFLQTIRIKDCTAFYFQVISVQSLQILSKISHMQSLIKQIEG